MVSLFWLISSFVYFCVFEFNFVGSIYLKRLAILFSILIRDLGAFYSQTLISLYTALNKDEDAYYLDDRINTKLSLLNFNVTMTHSLPLSFFKKFITTEQKNHEVYLNFYMLMEIYKVKINELWKKAK